MVRVIVFICAFLSFRSMVNAQEEEKTGAHKGMFAARGSIALGYMTDLAIQNAYLEGNLEYFVDDRISIRGDAFLFTNTVSEKQPFLFHHSIFTGPLYHFRPKKTFDPYLGLQPGVNLAQASNMCMGDPCLQTLVAIKMNPAASPLFSPILGFNYFGTKYFHLSVQARYIAGRFADEYNSVSLSEFRFSFGLGFNIR